MPRDRGGGDFQLPLDCNCDGIAAGSYFSCPPNKSAPRAVGYSPHLSYATEFDTPS